MSKKDFVFSVMLGFFIMATLLNLIISIVTGDIMVWMCTVLDAVTLILFIIWNKLNKIINSFCYYIDFIRVDKTKRK